MEYKVEAIILSSREIREFDRIYNIFSKEKGRLKITARGVRKPQAKLAGALEPLTKSEIFLIKGRMIDRVVGAIISDQFHSIKKDLEKTAKAKKVFDLIERLMTEGEPAEELYNELIYFLEKAGDLTEDKTRLIQAALIWKILKKSGYQADVYQCVNCGKRLTSGAKYWFLPAAGIVCQNCRNSINGNKLAISEEGIKILRLFSQKKLAIISKLKVEPAILNNLFGMLKALLENMLQRKMEL